VIVANVCEVGGENNVALLIAAKHKPAVCSGGFAESQLKTIQIVVGVIWAIIKRLGRRPLTTV
jgi:hypothetical protein